MSDKQLLITIEYRPFTDTKDVCHYFTDNTFTDAGKGENYISGEWRVRNNKVEWRDSSSYSETWNNDSYTDLILNAIIDRQLLGENDDG